jgi:hypothetical protein
MLVCLSIQLLTKASRPVTKVIGKIEEAKIIVVCHRISKVMKEVYKNKK